MTVRLKAEIERDKPKLPPINLDRTRELLYRYYNVLMDDYNGNASEEAIEILLEEVEAEQ